MTWSLLRKYSMNTISKQWHINHVCALRGHKWPSLETSCLLYQCFIIEQHMNLPRRMGVYLISSVYLFSTDIPLYCINLSYFNSRNRKWTPSQKMTSYRMAHARDTVGNTTNFHEWNRSKCPLVSIIIPINAVRCTKLNRRFN